jgi:hypothetical protein
MESECLPLFDLIPQLKRTVKKLWQGSLPIELADVIEPKMEWKHRESTVLIFDFDDTLFPTHVMERQFDLNEKASIQTQLRRAFRTEMKVSGIERQYAHFHKAVKELLQQAEHFGSVLIVTLGERKRVRNIVEHLWPEFGQLLEKCEFVYAREHMTEAMLEKASELNKMSVKLERLGVDAFEDDVERFLDDWSELWTSVKKEAILTHLTLHNSQAWMNVMSIGDSVFERDATILACNELRKTRAQGGQEMTVRVKTLKFLETPSLATLGLELRFLKLWLPYLVCQDCDRNLEFDTKLHLNEHFSSGEKVPFLGGQAPPSYVPGKGWSTSKQDYKSIMSWSSTEGNDEEPAIGA